MLLENNRQEDWKVLYLIFLYISETDIIIFECSSGLQILFMLHATVIFLELTAQPLIKNSSEVLHFMCICIFKQTHTPTCRKYPTLKNAC